MNAINRSLAHTVTGLLATGLVIFAFTSAPLGAQAGDAPDQGVRRLALEQYLQIEGVSDPRMSPDGQQIVYVRQWIDPVTGARIAHSRRATHLAGPHPETASPSWRAVRLEVIPGR
jgi:hypothetical protein